MKCTKKKRMLVLFWAILLASFLVLTQQLPYNLASETIEYAGTLADSTLFRYMGEAWLQKGIILYRDIFDHKGPLLFLIQGLISFVSPYPDMNMFRVVLILNLALSIMLSYKIVRIYCSRMQSIWITSLSFLCLKMTYTGNTCEEFMLPFILLSLYLVLRVLEIPQLIENKKIVLFYSGVIGLSVSAISLIRPNNALPLIIFLYPLWIMTKQKRSLFYKACLIAVISFLIPIFLFSIYFYFHGALFDFLNGWIFFSLIYSSKQSKLNIITSITEGVYRYGFVLIIQIANLVIVKRKFREDERRLIIARTCLIFTLLSIGICLIGNGGTRYWLVLVPIYLMSLIFIHQWISSFRTKRANLWKLCSTIVLIVSTSMFSFYRFDFEQIKIFSIDNKNENNKMVQMYQETANYINSQSGQNKVLGYMVSPIIYFEVDGKPVNKLIAFQEYWSIISKNVCEELTTFLKESFDVYVVLSDEQRFQACPTFKKNIDEYYELCQKIDEISVYQRKGECLNAKKQG